MIETKMKKITFSGYYGMKNYGDDLFGVVAAQGPDLYWTDIKNKLVCPNIKGTKASYAVPDWFPEDVYADLGYLGKMSRLGFATGSSLFSDKFIFCGGSVFSSNSSGVMNLLSLMYKKRNNFFSAIGVSIGPFDSIASEKKTKEFLKHFEYLALRDKLSFNIAKSFELDCPVVLAGDLAGLIPSFYPIKANKKILERSVKRIGFSPCFLMSDMDKSKKYCDVFIEAINQLKVDIDFDIMVLNLNEHPLIGDSELCKYVYEKLTNQNVRCELINYREDGVISTWKTISLLDAYISVRLHGAISAYLCEVPFALYEYHVKCTEFLNDIGQNELLRITDDFISTEHIKQVIIDLISKNGNNELDISDYCSKAQLNFTKAPWAISSETTLKDKSNA